MEEALFEEISEIRKQMQCRKKFTCVESGFKKLCKAKDIGLKRHLLCLEYVPSKCEFALLSDSKYYCGCLIRVYLAKNHQRTMLIDHESA